MSNKIRIIYSLKNQKTLYNPNATNRVPPLSNDKNILSHISLHRRLGKSSESLIYYRKKQVTEMM